MTRTARLTPERLSVGWQVDEAKKVMDEASTPEEKEIKLKGLSDLVRHTARRVPFPRACRALKLRSRRAQIAEVNREAQGLKDRRQVSGVRGKRSSKNKFLVRMSLSPAARVGRALTTRRSSSICNSS